MGWLSEEEPFSHNHNYFIKDSVPSSEYSLFPHQFSSPQSQPPQLQPQLQLQPPQPQVELEKPTATSPDDPIIVKKISHNANERDRRKKINSIISSLRSLLPVEDQTHKKSFPATITKVLKYIPELQQEVVGLSERKEELLSIISHQFKEVNEESLGKKIIHHNSDFIVSNSWLNDSEVAIHISTYEAHNYKVPLSDILLYLENNGHFMLNASSTETFEGRVFYNLHFQVEKAQRLDSNILTQMLLSIHEKKKKQRIFSSNMRLLKINRSSLL